MFQSLGRLRVPGGGRPRPPRSPHQSQCIEEDPSPVKWTPKTKTTLSTRSSLPMSPVFHTQSTLSNRSLSSQDLQVSESQPRRRKRLFADKPDYGGRGGEDSLSRDSFTSQKDLFRAMEDNNGLDGVMGSPSILTRSSRRQVQTNPTKASSEEEQDLFRGSSQESEIMVSPSPRKHPPPRKRKRFQKESPWKPLSPISELAPSQFIRDDPNDSIDSDSSLVPSEEQPSVKGSSNLTESLEKEPSIESVHSEEATAAAAQKSDGFGEHSRLSSTKKRRKNSKFGLFAKLERLQREQESDQALRRHVLPKLRPSRTHSSGESEKGMVDGNELTLQVTSVQEELFWRRVQCRRLADDEDSETDEVVLLLQRGVLGTALVDSIVEGVEIQVKGQLQEQCGGALFGVQALQVLDRPLRARLNLMSAKRTKTIIQWDCKC